MRRTSIALVAVLAALILTPVTAVGAPPAVHASDSRLAAITVPSGWAPVSDSDPRVTYTGTWRLYTGSAARWWGRSTHATWVPWATSTLRFEGTGAQIISVGCECGMASVYLDGQFNNWIDLSQGHGATQTPPLVRWARSDLVPGHHVLEIRAHGTGQLGYRRVNVDGFLIRP